jgi:hypothetical protein
MAGTLGSARWGEALTAGLLAASVALPLAVIGPPGGDAPAHEYRIDLVRDGVLVWDTFWFAGHYPLASYSLLYYVPAALVGNLPLAVAAAVLSSVLFAAIVGDEWGADGFWPSIAFAVVSVGPIFTGTYPYAVGLVFALAALRALQLGRTSLAAVCIVLTVGFSPLAFLFLTLALLAAGLVRRKLDWQTVAIAATAVLAGAVQAAALAVFAHDATYPFFRAGEFVAVLVAGALGTALAIRSPRGQILAVFFALWTLAAVLAFVVPSPLGENVTRFRGVLFPLMLLAAVLAGFRPRWVAYPALGGALLYTIVPYLVVIPFRLDGRSWRESFWTPAIAFLQQADTSQYRVEVVPTADHWDAYWIPRAGFPIARGWYRQLDYAENPLFYEDELRGEDYRSWLRRVGVRYVLLPDTQLDRAGDEKEAELLRSGRSGLRVVLQTPDWTIYELPDARTLLTGPGEAVIESFTHDSITGSVSAPGSYRLAVRFTPYWRLTSGALCMARAPDGMTELRFERGGRFRLDIELTARGSAVC